MKLLQQLSAAFLFVSFFLLPGRATTVYVTTQQEFDMAHDGAAINDTIIWPSGTYADIYMDIDKDHLFITAEVLGGTIFTGASRVNIRGDYITLQGFQFLDGDIGTQDVINTRGDYNVFTQINIRAYTSYKYLRVREESQFAEITYCNFENRLNLDDQNILSILVDESNPGYHKIQHCSFKNFAGTGNDLGIEPIRIGLSTQADRISRTLVEYCYFSQCDGDGELISSKATQNVYRFNTFEHNTKAELVLRHGSEAIVYGNFFLHGKGGVRVREGQHHYIYNNYFYDLDDRAIYLQNEASDPLSNIHIAFNTIVDCAEVKLGGDGSHAPAQVTLANNIFADPDDDLFEEATGTETWLGNIAFGSLGISLPSTGITSTDPQLEENSAGFFGLGQNSPAIDAAQEGYSPLPSFTGIDDIDTTIRFDLMQQQRPLLIAQKDLGANEYPHEVLIQPIATEENTGPSYPTSATTSLSSDIVVAEDFVKIRPNPVADYLYLTVYGTDSVQLRIDVFDAEGRNLMTLSRQAILPGEISLRESVADLPPGLYSLRVSRIGDQGEWAKTQVLKFIKVE